MAQETKKAAFSGNQSQGLMTDKEAAAHLNLSTSTLAVWRCTKREDLPYIKLGRAVRYRQSDLDNWLTAQTVSASA